MLDYYDIKCKSNTKLEGALNYLNIKKVKLHILCTAGRRRGARAAALFSVQSGVRKIEVRLLCFRKSIRYLYFH